MFPCPGGLLLPSLNVNTNYKEPATRKLLHAPADYRIKIGRGALADARLWVTFRNGRFSFQIWLKTAGRAVLVSNR